MPLSSAIFFLKRTLFNCMQPVINFDHKNQKFMSYSSSCKHIEEEEIALLIALENYFVKFLN